MNDRSAEVQEMKRLATISVAALKTGLAADKLPANPDKPGTVKEDGNVGE